MKQCLVIFVQLYLTNKQIEYFWKVWIGLHIIQTFYDLLPLVFKIMWGSWRSAWKRGTILFSYKILFLYFTSKKKKKFHTKSKSFIHSGTMGLGICDPTMLRSSEYSWTPSRVSKRYQWVSQRDFKIQTFVPGSSWNDEKIP